MNYLLDEEQVNLHLTLMLKAIAIGGQQFMLENLAYSNGLYASGLFRLMVPKSQAQSTNSEEIEEKEQRKLKSKLPGIFACKKKLEALINELIRLEYSIKESQLKS